MKKIEQKTLQFLTAMLDMYRDEDDRESHVFSKLNLDGEDLTEDMIAMLLGMLVFCQEATGYDGDLIDFTHMLNKLAIQHIMDGDSDV
jgi:hypothetical protein